MEKYNISDLKVGTVATNGHEVAVVTECVHGNKFYALVGADEPGTGHPVYVYDFEEEHLTGCCD